MNETTWNGQPDPVIDLTTTPALRGWPAPFVVPQHLAMGALEVLRGEYEPTPRGVRFELPPRARILDIGANVGAFAAWASARFPGAIVDSYEPNPRALRFLRENALTLPAVSVHDVGVRASSGEARLHEGGLNLGEASIHEDVGAKPDEGIPCRFVDAAGLDDAAIVKVDTEGCEVEILARYLASRPYVPMMVLLEFHRAIDRLVLEELLELRGLHLVRGTILSPDRGTLVFGRVAAPVRELRDEDVAELAERYRARVRPFARV